MYVYTHTRGDSFEESSRKDFEISPDIHVPSVGTSVSPSGWHVFSLSRESGYFIPRGVQTVFSGSFLRVATLKCPPVFDCRVTTVDFSPRRKEVATSRDERLANRDTAIGFLSGSIISLDRFVSSLAKKLRWPRWSTSRFALPLLRLGESVHYG